MDEITLFSDEALFNIFEKARNGSDKGVGVLRGIRAVERAVREATPQAKPVGVVFCDNAVHGWGMQALVPWEQLGVGTKLYAEPSATQEQAIAWKTTHKSVFVPITQVPAIAEEWRKAGFDVIDLFDHAGPCRQNADAKRLWITLQEVRNDFEREANRPRGQEAIVDTLWHGPCETLLDFIDNELEATKHLTHPYAAKAQPDQPSQEVEK